MKREIKFRAWDDFNSIMIYDSDDETDFKFYNGNALVKYTTEQHTVENGIDIDRPVWNQCDGPVMQFTGLKDLKGKDIYEGDILNGRNRILKIVYWCEKRAAFCESEQFKPTPAKHSFAKLYDKFGKVFNRNGTLENHYVVGNIYENPELLETQKAQL